MGRGGITLYGQKPHYNDLLTSMHYSVHIFHILLKVTEADNSLKMDSKHMDVSLVDYVGSISVANSKMLKQLCRCRALYLTPGGGGTHQEKVYPFLGRHRNTLTLTGTKNKETIPFLAQKLPKAHPIRPSICALQPMAVPPGDLTRSKYLSHLGNQNISDRLKEMPRTLCK